MKDSKDLLVVTMPAHASEQDRARAQEFLTPWAERNGMTVLALPHGMQAKIENNETADAINRNTAAVLELCGLVVGMLEGPEEEPSIDSMGVPMTINGPSRKKP